MNSAPNHLVWSSGLTARMSEERMIRRDNLKLLMKERGWKKADLARELQFTDVYASRLVEGKVSFGEKAARKIERFTGKPHGWLDAVHLGGTYESDPLLDAPLSTGDEPPISVKQPIPVYRGVAAGQVDVVSDAHGKKPQRAPVVAWAALEKSVLTPNREWPDEAMTSFIAIEAVEQASDFTKLARVLDSPFPHIEVGDHVAIDPQQPPWDGCMVVIRTTGGRVMLRRYRALAASGFEAVCPNEMPLDSVRHGIALVGVVVSLIKSQI